MIVHLLSIAPRQIHSSHHSNLDNIVTDVLSFLSDPRVGSFEERGFCGLEIVQFLLRQTVNPRRDRA